MTLIEISKFLNTIPFAVILPLVAAFFFFVFAVTGDKRFNGIAMGLMCLLLTLGIYKAKYLSKKALSIERSLQKAMDKIDRAL